MINIKGKKAFILWFSCLLFIITTISAYFIVPSLIKNYIIDNLSKELQRRITVKSVTFNPITLGLTIDGFNLYEPSGDKVFISFDELYANIEI
ncbi:MAG: hypothetical protein N3A62_02040, partial [Thermodesulfovibrionales bacterium]|nr:hypothetical protein [Thermodesulfovibrionales bacterium]